MTGETGHCRSPTGPAARRPPPHQVGAPVVNFTENAVQQMVQEDPTSPVVMLNLLRFRPDGGELSYRAYLESNAAVWARYGVEPLYAGSGSTPLVAEPGQDWDAVAVVRYPHNPGRGGPRRLTDPPPRGATSACCQRRLPGRVRIAET
jgi:hypothetical protein